jgi:hypothetical protein
MHPFPGSKKWCPTRIEWTDLPRRRNSDSRVRLPDATIGLRPEDCYEEAVVLFREVGEPLVLAHVVRHLGDVYVEQGCLELAEPCYCEALELYRSHPDVSSLDFANAVRSLAVLRWEQARGLWEQVGELYTRLNIEAGIKESTARVTSLSTN